MGRRGKQPRGVIDTSVLVAGVAGFKSLRAVENPSASLLRYWLEDGTFIWLITEDILAPYKEVLSRLGFDETYQIRPITHFARVQSKGTPRLSPR